MHFDVVVIGAGPGGYIAAIRASQLGMSVACIDDWKNENGKPSPGGTCTNVGCIPSKALLFSSELFEKCSHLKEHGIRFSEIDLDLSLLLQRKSSIVKKNNDGILHLFKKNKVSFFHGKASSLEMDKGVWSVVVKKANNDEEEQLHAKHIIIATGSVPRELSNLPIDEHLVLSNKGALELNSIPDRICVIGGGAIGLEMGSVWRRLGSKVTILESMPDFLSNTDRQVSREAIKIFRKQGLDIQLDVEIIKNHLDKKSVMLDYLDSKKVLHSEVFDNVIVSIGRVPNLGNLRLINSTLECDKNGFVIVDEHCKTSLENLWAVGDVVRGPMLAHKAEEEGIAVAECIAGQHGHVNFKTVPNVIYTSPEIAWVGDNEEKLIQQGRKYKVGTFPFLANGRARVIGETSGFAKVIADAKTDEILGVHIIGPSASELISEAVSIMEFRGSSEDIARICHAHPTLSESLKEAALSVERRSLNF